MVLRLYNNLACNVGGYGKVPIRSAAHPSESSFERSDVYNLKSDLHSLRPDPYSLRSDLHNLRNSYFRFHFRIEIGTCWSSIGYYDRTTELGSHILFTTMRILFR